MWTLTVLSVALCATRLACASTSDVALTEQKIQMSKLGTLEYGSLSELEKLRLFKQYEQDCKRKVTISRFMAGCNCSKMRQMTTNTSHLTPNMFYISTVLINYRGEGQIRSIRAVPAAY